MTYKYSMNNQEIQNTLYVQRFIRLYLKSLGICSKKLISLYNEDFRAYHNLMHIGDLLNQLDRHVIVHNNLNAEEVRLLTLAIIFHDVIYVVGAKNNETLSAQFFKDKATDSVLNLSPLTDIEIQAVQNLILTTINHEPYQFNFPQFDLKKLSELLIQFDLNGFYVDNFLDYEKLVQKEFSTKFTWEEYKEGHIKFLEAYKPKVKLNKSVVNMETLIEYCKNSNGYTFDK